MKSRSFKYHILTLLGGKHNFSYYMGKWTQKCISDRCECGEESRMFYFLYKVLEFLFSLLFGSGDF